MARTLKAIETKYNGYRFRSRLEARWAVCFDAAGISYQYEVEGYDFGHDRYLPDFYLPIQEMFIEIKPQFPPSHQEVNRLDCLTRTTNKEAVMLMGEPYIGSYDILSIYYNNNNYICTGIDPSEGYLKPWKGHHTSLICGCSKCPGLCWVKHNFPRKGSWKGMKFPWGYFGLHQCGRTGFPEFWNPSYYEAARSARFEFGESG